MYPSVSSLRRGVIVCLCATTVLYAQMTPAPPPGASTPPSASDPSSPPPAATPPAATPTPTPSPSIPIPGTNGGVTLPGNPLSGITNPLTGNNQRNQRNTNNDRRRTDEDNADSDKDANTNKKASPPPPPAKSSGLPGVAIALIVLGSLAVVIFVAATVVRWKRKNRHARLRSFHAGDIEDQTDMFTGRPGAGGDVFARDLGRYHRNDEVVYDYQGDVVPASGLAKPLMTAQSAGTLYEHHPYEHDPMPPPMSTVSSIPKHAPPPPPQVFGDAGYGAPVGASRFPLAEPVAPAVMPSPPSDKVYVGEGGGGRSYLRDAMSTEPGMSSYQQRRQMADFYGSYGGY